jgi:hypothetical protein
MKFRNVLTCSQAEQALRLWDFSMENRLTSASSEDSAVFPGLQYHSDWTRNHGAESSTMEAFRTDSSTSATTGAMGIQIP